MIGINLLPHREARRVADVRQTVAILVLGLVLQGAVMFYMNADVKASLRAADLSVRQLESDIERYKPQQLQVESFKKTRKDLESKLGVIEGLEKARTGPVRLLDELASHTPDRLWLTGVRTVGTAITLEGESLDNGVVADFLRGLNDSEYFSNVDLDKTARGKEVEGVKIVTFVITAELTRPGEKTVVSGTGGTS